MNGFKRFNEKKLSTRKYFYRSTKDEKIGDDGQISDGHISVKDYLTCEKIWDNFNMTNMGDYHDDYLKKDVLFMADVFEKFIDTSLKYYGLDPCHYFRSPGLTWSAMVKMAGVNLEKISDIDKYLLIMCAYNVIITFKRLTEKDVMLTNLHFHVLHFYCTHFQAIFLFNKSFYQQTFNTILKLTGAYIL